MKRYGEGIPLDSRQRKQYDQEWLELSSRNHLLRLWDSGDIIGCDENELDPVIVSAVAKLQSENTERDFIKGSDVVSVFWRKHVSSFRFPSSHIAYGNWSAIVSLGFRGYLGLPINFHCG
ncbi:DUF3658 domain-containing protein [Paenibacillus sanfengchensis]|uniref:DUF3658 domain-containing protein n=1 Tax=Paenibacillus TaxID=44249 RepID=UPI003A5C5E9D